MTTEREIEMMGADAYTVLALALDGAMYGNQAARDAYRAIYGVEWVPLHAAADRASNSTAPSTTCATVR